VNCHVAKFSYHYASQTRFDLNYSQISGGNFMYMQCARLLTVFLAIIVSLTLLAACDTGSQSSDATDTSAARQNVDAMSREHADDNGMPGPGAAIQPRRAVVAERLPYAEVDEQLFYGHFAFPADMVDPLPGLIVIHEWWGLNDGIRAMADRLAAEGYVVLAVDLFGAEAVVDPAAARAMMLSVVENPELANENIRQAYQFLADTAQAPRIGSLGWCFGGGWSLNTALLFPDELDATVIYYGQVTDNDERLLPLNVPILGLFGAEDRGIPVASVQGFEQALERLRKDYEIEIYANAEHAFANPSGNSYNAEVAEKAWARTIEFLDMHLSTGESAAE
jgi:carboxymethylenebutenolidase